jgi:D-aminopeptidase
VHSPFDGDLVFSLATGRIPLQGCAFDIAELGTAGAAVMARAIARGIYEATPAPGDTVPTWRQRFGA